MKKLLNTLYIVHPDAYLGKDGENVVVKVDDEIKFRVPVHTLDSIVHFGYTGASAALMNMCAVSGVTITFCDPNGRFLARVEGPISGNILLRRTQYRLADSPFHSARIAASIVTGKIMNSRAALQRQLRDHPDCIPDNGATIIEQLARLARRAKVTENLDIIRGIEGEAATIYWRGFNCGIFNDSEFFSFNQRSRRPPLDAINCMLSFLYTLLVHDCRSALESVGLDPAAGYLHRDRPGRPSLALDLMEEFRSYLVDRLVLSLINKRQVSRSDFETQAGGAVIMRDNTRSAIITAWQKRKREEITHPYLQKKIETGLLPYVQAMLLARYIRGELDDYPTFIVK